MRSGGPSENGRVAHEAFVKLNDAAAVLAEHFNELEKEKKGAAASNNQRE